MEQEPFLIYHLKVALPCYDEETGNVVEETNLYRILAVAEGTSLKQLAALIINAFDFDFDHLYGFFDNHRNPSKSIRKYTKNFGNIYVEDVFTRKQKKWCFLYDSGDEWHFWIYLLKKQEARKGERFPKIVKSVGESPEQYSEAEEWGADKEILMNLDFGSKKIAVEIVDDKEWEKIEKQQQASLDAKIKKGELLKSVFNLPTYVDYLNRNMDLPCEATITQDGGMFGEIQTRIVLQKFESEKRNVTAVCIVGNKTIPVDVHTLENISGSNKKYIEKFKEWLSDSR